MEDAQGLDVLVHDVQKVDVVVHVLAETCRHLLGLVVYVLVLYPAVNVLVMFMILMSTIGVQLI